MRRTPHPLNRKPYVYDPSLQVFKFYLERVKIESYKIIKCLRTDNKGEYNSKELDEYYKEECIKR